MINFGDARLILFIHILLRFLFQKCRDPMLGYGQNIQSDWNINAAEFKIFYPLTH